MQATSNFFQWWFEAWGVGGWVVFFLLVVAAIVFVIYDSQTRRIRALGWLLGAILPALLLFPSLLFGLSPETRMRLQNLQELVFYLGLIGGIVPLVVAAGYYITVRDTRGCDKGHVYQASLGECPICAQERQRAKTPEGRSSRPPRGPDFVDPVVTPPGKAKVNAWLVDEGTNRTYQLARGDTRVGRSKQGNEIVLADQAVSREHLLIREESGHFTVYDRGSRTGTLVNGRRIDSPILLAHDDTIEVGDTRLRFVTSRG